MGEIRTSYNFIWIAITLLVCILNGLKADPIVGTKLGNVRGTILTSDNGKPFYAFRGIPYAKPPVKQLRFKPPVPVSEWQDTLDATENGAACIQLDVTRKGFITGDEDCLFLNVYTKQFTTSNLRPVMVFIHGGGFNCGEGSSDLYGPERLLDKDIVLVTINYRLSALGFLSTEDVESPGNYGLLDQVEALKWIQNHVENFGGDPKSVTIFGESAGGAAVIYHLISPLSKGLFHGVIAQSGTAIHTWALQTEPLKKAEELGVALNCPTDNTKNLVNCLRKRPALDIMMRSALVNFHNDMVIHYEPVVDKGFGGSVEFLQERPMSLLTNQKINKVPVMIGNVKDEAYPFLLMFSMEHGGPENFEKEHLYSKLNKMFDRDMLEKFVKGYFNNADLSDPHQKIKTYSELLSDLVMNADIDVAINSLVASGIPTYAYSVTYSGEYSYADAESSVLHEDYSKTMKMVSHLDELQYLFRLGIFQNDLNEKDKQTAEKMITLWTNFAKNKVPSLDGCDVDNKPLEWNPVQPNQETQYLNIGEELRMETGTFCSRPDLWKEYRAKDEL